MTRPPRAPAGTGSGTGRGKPASGFHLAGFTITFTAGAYLLAMLVVLAGATSLPAIAPGWPAAAYLAATAGLVLAFLASLVVHELAHAVVARRYGATTRDIRIGFFGGGQHGAQDFRTARAQGRVASAGPAATLAIAALSVGAAAGLAALGAGRLAVVALAAVALINTAFTVLNLLPGAGMDGGRIVHALAWGRSGDRARSAVTAARVGQYTGALLIAGGVALLALGYFDGIWAGLLGLLMVGTSRAQAREVLTIASLANLTVADALPMPPPVAPPAWQTVQAFLDGTGLAGDQPGPAGLTGPTASNATAFPLRDFDGRAAGVLTLSQLAAVPPGDRDSRRLIDVATPAAYVVTATLEEPLSRLLARLSIRPAVPAALHTAGHALVIGDDGTPLGVLTPADFARASQLGALHPGRLRP